jgi:hypothetical protein
MSKTSRNIEMAVMERRLAYDTLVEMYPWFRKLHAGTQRELIKSMLADFYAQPGEAMTKWRDFAVSWVESRKDAADRDHEITIRPPKWPSAYRDAEIVFGSPGSGTYVQGVTRSDLERLAAEITRWQAENGTGND